MTVREAAAILRRSPSYLRKLLSVHRDQFDQPHYERDGQHPRQLRLITDKDLEVLRHIIQTAVK